MVIISPQDAKFYTATVLQGKEILAQGNCRLLLEPTLAQPCQSGQYINVRSKDGLERSFAIVNQPADEFFIEIHVHKVAGDRFSNWIFDQLEVEAELEIQGPYDEAPLTSQAAAASSTEEESSRPKDPPPDMELWAALQDGKLMMDILQDFYGRVYQDELLSPYFHGITKQRSIEKVYSFFQQVMTGQKCYFGDRPKNAHHWMVISDETFKYREELMIECQRRAGLSEEMIKRWIAIENYYKKDIVKSEPWKKMVGGVERPLDGFGEVTLDTGAVCDGCGRVMDAGEKAKYHLRIGTMYCAVCNGQTAAVAG
jgi:truncated hemoglobin YjbI